MSLMRRNNIFLSHGGSSLLSNQRKTTRAKKTFEVVSDQGGGSFLKLFLPGENAWVHAGMFVLYNGGTKGGDVARLVAFRRGSRLGAVLVTVRKCRCVETSSVLSRHTQAWCLRNGPGSTVDLELDSQSDLGIELYPMQCDFSDVDRFYSCPYMRTV